jgi:hypothetical protein
MDFIIYRGVEIRRFTSLTTPSGFAFYVAHHRCLSLASAQALIRNMVAR